MKKILVAFVLVVLLVSLCACGVPSNSFMSRSKVNSLVKNYPEPKAEVTLSYKTGNNEFEVKVTYKLLLEQAPIAVTRFIQIAKDGGYDDTRVDTVNTSLKYAVMGRYRQDSESSKYYNDRSADVTFAGEFASNDYREPKSGYAQFKVFSLAMFHENDGEHFNSANGTLILALANQTLNSANYAVFAEFESMTVSINGGAARTYRNVQDNILNHLLGFTSTDTNTVYDSTAENANSESVRMTSTPVTLKVQVSGADDNWSKLPTIR